MILLALRAAWAFRFRRNLHCGGWRRVMSIATWTALDGALPAAALVLVPLLSDVQWATILGTNLELGFLELLASAVLLCVFAAKVVLLVLSKKIKP